MKPMKPFANVPAKPVAPKLSARLQQRQSVGAKRGQEAREATHKGALALGTAVMELNSSGPTNPIALGRAALLANDLLLMIEQRPDALTGSLDVMRHVVSVAGQFAKLAGDAEDLNGVAGREVAQTAQRVLAGVRSATMPVELAQAEAELAEMRKAGNADVALLDRIAPLALRVVDGGARGLQIASNFELEQPAAGRSRPARDTVDELVKVLARLSQTRGTTLVPDRAN